jgi:quercetin 2,3-dioxygenase
MTKINLIKSETRGQADHGWLKAKHSFSFAGYHDPARIHFGALRVLNDDTIAGGAGFGMHPHDNMEIITIPLSGALEHKDSMGNHGVIKAGDIQVMSAGTGIFHSEFNHNADEICTLFQIWLFPNKKNVTPRYDQQSISKEGRKNKFQRIVSPHGETHEGEMWIHQEAWFHLIDLSENTSVTYSTLGNNHGVYAMQIEGESNIESTLLKRRDAAEITECKSFTITSGNKPASLLLMEVPL